MHSPSLRSAIATMTQSLEVRPCPACCRLVLRGADRCNYCWTKLAASGSALDGIGTSVVR
jgi:hypothetical protein